MKIDKVVTLATAYIEDPEGKILLLKRGTKSTLSGYWQFAEGKIEKGEFPDEALEREVSEELSLEAMDSRRFFCLFCVQVLQTNPEAKVVSAVIGNVSRVI